MIGRFFLSWLFQLTIVVVVLAQKDSVARVPPETKRNAFSLVLPAALTVYGFVALNSHPLQSFDRNIREAVWFDNPHHPFPLDDYLQYAPGAAVYILNAAGIKGRNNFWDRTIIYAMANAMMGITVLSLKSAIYAKRPDGSANDGFPSGHAATAFAAAEFLRQEYRDVSWWYGAGGYTAAIVTAYLRVYNDQHWFSEVVTGAGIGILSAKLSYWIFPAVQKRLPGYKKTFVIP